MAKTGLKDKNGVEIQHGHTIRYLNDSQEDPEYQYLEEVIEDGWTGDQISRTYGDDIEVIK